jgi:hypothetical protein
MAIGYDVKVRPDSIFEKLDLHVNDTILKSHLLPVDVTAKM